MIFVSFVLGFTCLIASIPEAVFWIRNIWIWVRIRIPIQTAAESESNPDPDSDKVSDAKEIFFLSNTNI
jgi:hypothetical protein